MDEFSLNVEAELEKDEFFEHYKRWYFYGSNKRVICNLYEKKKKKIIQ